MSKQLAAKSKVALTPKEPTMRHPRVEVKNDNYFSIYANEVRVQTALWDVRLTWGQIDGDRADTVTVNQAGEIRISPQLAKSLTKILFTQLKTYEDKYGAIPEPEDPKD